MDKPSEFLNKVETALNLRIGNIIAGSVLKNNLLKLKKDPSSLTAEDCKVLVEHIVKAVSLFVTKDESRSIKVELEDLLKTLE